MALNQLQTIDFIGAGERTRTPDRLITNQQLYQLSYASTTLKVSLSSLTPLRCAYHPQPRPPWLGVRRFSSSARNDCSAITTTYPTELRQHNLESFLVVPDATAVSFMGNGNILREASGISSLTTKNRLRWRPVVSKRGTKRTLALLLSRQFDIDPELRGLDRSLFHAGVIADIR